MKKILFEKISGNIGKKIKKVLIRTNFGKEIGLGHLKRCLAIEGYFRKIDPSIDFYWAINQETALIKDDFIIVANNFDDQEIKTIEELSPDLLIVDSYLVNFSYLDNLSKKTNILLFDDYNRFEEYPPIFILNGNIYAEDLNYNRATGAYFFLGLDYLFLSEEYNQFEPISANKKSILITTGSTDEEGMIFKFAHWLKDLRNYHISFVIGPYFRNPKQTISEIKELNSDYGIIFAKKSLRDDILKSELVISTSGVSAYEVIRCQRKLICFQTADNQNLIGRAVGKRKLGINLGSYLQLNKEKLLKAIGEYFR